MESSYIPPNRPEFLRIGVVVAVAAAIGALVYFGLIRDDSNETAARGDGASLRAGAGPVVADSDDLLALADRLEAPVYWAGDQGEAALELTRTNDDRVFVRYLDEGVEPGDPAPDFLTVGTYPLPDAFAALEKQAEEDGSLVTDAPGGGIVITNEGAPTSVYLAFPDEDFQIEVFDPDPERALDLATSGLVEPVD